jgi:localization factor PodJL
VAAEQGSASALRALGLLHESGALGKPDIAAARAWHEQAAAAGDAIAQAHLAAFYLEGRGVRRDLHRALQLYRQAARQENSEALHGLGRMYAQGEGVARDYANAWMLADIAATLGSAQAAADRDVYAQRMSEEELRRARMAVESWKPGAPLPLLSPLSPS